MALGVAKRDFMIAFLFYISWFLFQTIMMKEIIAYFA